MSFFKRVNAPFEVVEEIPPDINRKYRRTSPTSFACRTCSANVLSEVVTPIVARLVADLTPHGGPGYADECATASHRDCVDVWPLFAIWLLRVQVPAASGERVAILYDRVLQGEVVAIEEWRAAAYAAANAYAAAANANAADAAYAAANAAYAYAAYADANAAYAYADAERKWQADEIRKLVKNPF